MGLFQSRQDRGVEDIEITAARTYGYPPKYGNFFSSHFIMGGEKFKTVNPESFLFGDNSDLSFLSNKPIVFPYPAPASEAEPSRTLRSLVHLRKDTLRLSRVSDEQGSNDYRIEFTFDADVACAVRIYLFAAENLAGGIARYTSRNRQSEPVFFQRGTNRLFNNSSFEIDPSKFNEDEFQFQPSGVASEAMAIPIVIQITVEEEEFSSQCEVTFATFEKNSDNTYSIKLLKQKIVADGICYIIQEIYGIENKKDGSKDKEDDYDENGVECVICMCDLRDTLILPCRHLCLCNGCANSLRFQASNCPICRSPFHALLQIKAVRKKAVDSDGNAKAVGKENNQETEEYEEVPLVEALNGYQPQDGTTGYSSRQSSARRSRSRNGSRPSSRKSRPGSRNGTRSSNCLPPVDKLEHPIVSRSCSGSDDNNSGGQQKIMAVKQTSVEVKSKQEDGELEEVVASSTDPKEHNDDEQSEDLQASFQSQALHEMITDAPNEAVQLIGENPIDLIPNVDLSLPGTPLGSDFSNRSTSSMSTQKTTSTTAGSGSSVYSARGQISTPSNVNIEED